MFDFKYAVIVRLNLKVKYFHISPSDSVFFCALVHTGCFVSISGEAVCVYLWIKLQAGFSFYRLYLFNGRVKFKIRGKKIY